jgi:hypothetical protein
MNSNPSARTPSQRCNHCDKTEQEVGTMSAQHSHGGTMCRHCIDELDRDERYNRD